MFVRDSQVLTVCGSVDEEDTCELEQVRYILILKKQE